MKFEPSENLVGGFTPNDGTIDFYLRIRSLIDVTQEVADFGAGRAGWYEDDRCEIRRSIRALRGDVARLVALDIDQTVLKNAATDEQFIIDDDSVRKLSKSFDVVIADYVLEHIDDEHKFFNQINTLLKNGGWFCARTPHKYHYASLAARVVPSTLHNMVLRKAQAGRKDEDIFPTSFRLNTKKEIEDLFSGWYSQTFISRSDAAYFFGSKIFYNLLSVMHRLAPAPACGNIFVFLKKPCLERGEQALTKI